MFLDLPQEILLSLFTGYLVILGAVFLWGWLLCGMRSRAAEFRFRGDLERTERLYRE